MQTFTLYEIQTHLSQLIEKANKGSSFIIAKAGKPLAKIVPLNDKKDNAFRFGTLKGKIKVSDDFDAPLPAELLNLFEGQ